VNVGVDQIEEVPGGLQKLFVLFPIGAFQNARCLDSIDQSWFEMFEKSLLPIEQFVLFGNQIDVRFAPVWKKVNLI
jgi:hypothetical protein